MLKNVSRLQLVAAWIAIVVVLFAVSVFRGAELSVARAELWLLMCLAPPSVMRSSLTMPSTVSYHWADAATSRTLMTI